MVVDKKKLQIGIVFLQLVLAIGIIRFLTGTFTTEGIIETVFIAGGIFFALSVFIIRIVFKKETKSYFLSLPGNKRSFLWSMVLWGLFVSAIFVFVVKFGGEKYLVVSSWLGSSSGVVVLVDLLFLPIILFSFEVFFRGLFLGVLRDRWGVVSAILGSSVMYVMFLLLTGVRSFLWFDVLLMFFLSVCLGVVAVKNKSIVASWLLHWIFMFSIDMYGLYKINQIINGG